MTSSAHRQGRGSKLPQDKAQASLRTPKLATALMWRSLLRLTPPFLKPRTSELELQGKLYQAWIRHRADTPGSGRAEIQTGAAKVGSVGEIEGLEAKLQITPFRAHGEVLRGKEIQVLPAGTIDQVAA